MDIRKPVKFLIVKNPHYEIGFTNIKQLKILQMERQPSTRKRKLKNYK